MALAREGYEVTLVQKDQANTCPSKENVVFTTQDPDVAADWTDKMYKKGYTVTITYDDETGIYTCIAIK